MGAATILLVDDDEVLSQVLRRVLTRDGYRVVEAGSVAQALELIREDKPQLGLLDLSLPDGDGMGLATKLRAGRGMSVDPRDGLSAPPARPARTQRRLHAHSDQAA